MDLGGSSNNSPDLSMSHILAKVWDKMYAMLCLACMPSLVLIAAFMRKGKVRPLETMLRSPVYNAAFMLVGNLPALEPKTIEVLESYVCSMYEKGQLDKVDDVKCALFMSAVAPKLYQNPLAGIRHCDSSSLSSCQVYFTRCSRGRITCPLFGNMRTVLTQS